MKYPCKRKRWRSTIWKAPKGIRLHAGTMSLSQACGLASVQVRLPTNLAPLPTAAFLEVRLVWDRAARHYNWHVVVEDGMKPAPPSPGDHTAAVDLGEVHPATLTDGQETVILSCRALRASQRAVHHQAPLPTLRQTSTQRPGLAEMASALMALESISGETEAPGT